MQERQLLLTQVNSTDKERINKTYAFAKKHLSSEKRRNGISYFQHGYELALTVKEVTNNPEFINALLLHDLLVHPQGKKFYSIAPLTRAEKELLKKMHDMRRLHINKNTNDLDYVIREMTKDPRLVLLRMVHRLNDVRAICTFKAPLRKEIAKESLHMYAAIAGRLGLHKWRYEMEDICFRILHPSISKRLSNKYASYRDVDTESLEHTKKFLLAKLKKANVKGKIDTRIKSLYSTYRKMVIKKRKFHELTDRLALRIIVDTVEDCYKSLGIVHSSMNPMPGKLKDYIGAPKENGYRSIHTVVYPLPGVSAQPIEIQIRTKEMHRECEYGIAAHDDYKTFHYNLSVNPTRVSLFRNLELLKREVNSPEQFTDAMRTYFSEDRLMVFDHKNNLYHFKKPATALDFALIVYERKCKMLKNIFINGREQPYDTELHDGDVVQVHFGNIVKFDREWRSICHRNSSRQLIHELEAEKKENS